jgi:DNA helicase II / ATP-dependent DNA helicase PcrA
MDLLSELNPVQRDAVTHTGGPLLILAGAGSGKTRVLTYHIAYLVRERGVSPDRILAITFTNKAAQEMRSRVDQLVGSRLSRHMWVMTFHAACARILRNDADRLGFKKSFSIYDADDSRKLVDLCARDLGVDVRRYTPQMLAGRISSAKNDLVDHETFAGRAVSPFDKVVADVYRLYTQRLAEHDAMDFDDLLVNAVTLLDAFPSVREAYQERFQHVLVDEYQDTNKAQYQLIRLIGGGHGNVTVVGDDDQSIYRWRGADIRNILEFERDFPEATVIRLEQNYRSTQLILDCANQVIGHNKSRKPKTLWTENVGGEPVSTYLATDEHGEASFVVSEMERLMRAEKKAFRDFAVFYRVHAQSRVFEDAMMRSGIPYRVFGGMKFYERAEIKDVVAYMRLAANPSDEVSLRRVVNVPRRGIGDTSLERATIYAAREGVPLLEAMRRADLVPGLTARAAKALTAFAALADELAAEILPMTPSDAVARVTEKTGYLKSLDDDSTIESLSRAENVREFVTVAQEFERLDPEMTLEGFLERIALIADIDKYDAGEDSVVLMTLHNAKGLEFPVVFITGLEEGVFPHHRSMTDTEELEEERRLCYVGITRARERVYLTSAMGRTMYGNTSFNLKSRFLSEVPEELTRAAPGSGAGVPAWQGKRGTADAWQTSLKVPSAKDASSGGGAGAGAKGGGKARQGEDGTAGAGAARETARETAGFSVGDHVRHRIFGDGVVTAVKAPDQITVDFEGDAGTKTLLAGYAPLEPVARG